MKPAGNSDDDNQEREFFEFTRDLLNAQKRKVLVGREFTRTTLKEILTEFCNVLAKKEHVESVTIHLKVYDPSLLRNGECRYLNERIGRNPTHPYPDSRMDEDSSNITASTNLRPHYRDDPLYSTLAFPFSALPRGGLQLVAWNDTSPWKDLLSGRYFTAASTIAVEAFSIVQLNAGISAQIVQDNWARKQGRSKILETRNDRKLGVADAIVWTNAGLNRMFRNYYGVPIKLHVDGEVIGILKLENAKNPDGGSAHLGSSQAISKVADDGLTMRMLAQQIINLVAEQADASRYPHSLSPDLPLHTLVKNLISIRTGDRPVAWDEYRATLAEPGVSLLALAYLQDDLEQAAGAIKRTVASEECLAVTFFPPYPHVNRLLRKSEEYNERHIQTLTPPNNTKPPLQLWAKNESSEHWLWDCIKRKGQRAPSLDRLLSTLRRIRTEIATELRDGKEVIVTHGITFTVRRDREYGGTSLPPFTYRLIAGGHSNRKQATKSTGKSVEFFAVVPPGINPTKGELGGHISGQELEVFKAINPKWFRKRPSTITVETFYYRGEHVTAVIEETTRNSVQVRNFPDLLVDRLAARVQALIYSLPIPEFPPDHAKTLTWAAREVANLVQKEIVFRGNRATGAMPLTAVDFERLPISDLSFVDDLRSRIARAESIKPNIDHHFQNLLTDWNMVPTVRYGSRVKDGCSHLDRLGERHEGFIRGALAVWFFILSGLVRKGSASSEPASRFCRLLGRFQELVLNAVSDAAHRSLTQERLKDSLEMIQRWNTDRVNNGAAAASLPSPPFADLGFFSWPWRDDNRECDGRNLWQFVADNLQMSGCHQEAYFGDLLKEGGLSPKALANCVLRNHEVYVRQASSLLVQLFETHPQAAHGKEYEIFYSTAFALRRLLGRSPREIEDNPKLACVKRLYSTTVESPAHDDGPATDPKVLWDELVNYAVSNSTDEFLTENGGDLTLVDDTDRARLTAAAIYKRVRTLHYRLREQRSSAHLEWDLERFDLFGCQLNCLYKNQVAALYEEIWDRGDPFSGRSIEGEWKISRRTRWVCLRTTFHTGDYNSLQIAALVDSSAIRRGFWELELDDAASPPRGALYNLSLLRFYWTQCVRHFSHTGSGFFAQYCSLAKRRREWTSQYVDWFQAAERLWQSEVSEPPNSFGIALCGAVVDLIIWTLGKLRARVERSAKDRPHALQHSIRKLSFSLFELLKSVEPHVHNQAAVEDVLNEDWNKQWLKDLITQTERLIDAFYAVDNDEFLKACRNWCGTRNMKPDEQEFLDTTIDRVCPLERSIWESKERSPLLKRFARGMIFFARALGEEEFHIFLNDLAESTGVEAQLRAWERFRRGQKEFLFWLGADSSSIAEGLRSRDEVLGRLENYALLFCKTLDGLNVSSVASTFEKWNARDLFYYVRSLVPMEVQVRTHLANVLAEQYHDRVYKQHPRAGSLVPRSRMIQVAADLDEIDKELEADFEGYVERESNRKVPDSSDSESGCGI